MLFEVGGHDGLIAVLAAGVVVQTAVLRKGVHAGNSLVAVRIRAVNKGVLAVPLVVSDHEAAGGDVLAWRIGTFNLETIELVGDDAGGAQLVGVKVEWLAVNGADGLDLGGSPQAARAESVAAIFSSDRVVEGGSADGADEGFVDGFFVF